MTAEEAAKVAKIMLTVDGWCSTCQDNIFALFREAFPDHAGVIDDILAQREAIQAAVAAAEDAADLADTGEPYPRVWEMA